MTTHMEYQPPRATRIGSAATVVHANIDGDRTDADFPAGTPRGDLTFS